MTNHWNDIKNAKVILSFSNPAENHPSSMQWINEARANGAKLIVVEPRKTRLAGLADLFVRIRPGTDNALVNGLIRRVIELIENGTLGKKYLETDKATRKLWARYCTTLVAVVPPKQIQVTSITGFAVNDKISVGAGLPNVEERSIQSIDSINNIFTLDSALTKAHNTGELVASYKYSWKEVANWPKHTDALFKLNGTPGANYLDSTDYARENVGVGDDYFAIGVPKRAANLNDPACVFQYLKRRVAAYTPEVVADICGCSVKDFEGLAKMYINNSWAKTQVTPITWPPVGDYRVGTILYAMGTTQHTVGSQNTRNYCILQLLLGNMGKYGSGLNALRGWNNVQGICDMGILFNTLPGYIGAPTGPPYPSYGEFLNKLFGNPIIVGGTHDGKPQTGSSYGLQQLGYINMLNYWFADGRYDAITDVAIFRDVLHPLMCSSAGYSLLDMLKKAKEGHVKAMIVLAQNPAVGVANTNLAREGLKELDTLVVMDMFLTETAECDRKYTGVTYFLPCASFAEKCGSVTNSGHWITWRYQAIPPKGNCKTDFEIILRLAKKLDVAGAFAQIPLLSGHDNRYDMLFTSQYGFDGDNWSNNEYKKTTGVEATTGYCEKVYAQMCRPLDLKGTLWIFSRAGGVDWRPLLGPDTGIGTILGGWEPNADGAIDSTYKLSDFTPAGRTVNRSQARDITTGAATGIYQGFGHSWLLNRRIFYNNNAAPGDVADFFVAADWVGRIFVHYTGQAPFVDYTRFYQYTTLAEPDGRTPKHWEPWETPRLDFLGWKIRVYSTVGFNVGDSVTVGQGLPTAETKIVATVIGDTITFTTQLDNNHNAGETVYNNTTGASTTLLDPVKLYKPVGVAPTYPTEYANTSVEVAEFPLVLTTFRQTEHWHSGQMTRNLPWLAELKPKPIIEINSADAADYGIVSGDEVEIMSMRTAIRTSLTVAAVAGTDVLNVASTTGFVAEDEILINAGQPNQETKEILTVVSTTQLKLTTNLNFDHAVGESVLNLDKGLVGPFVAEVGTGLQPNQRVGKGTVAIPLHWAEKGANESTAVANKLTINALDANAKMPETKACLCRIRKKP